MRPYTTDLIYLCPADKRLLCPWEGYASDIKQHFEKEHNGLLFSTNVVEIDLENLHDENRLVYYQDELYLVQTHHHLTQNKLLVKLRVPQPRQLLQYKLEVSVNNMKCNESCLSSTLEGWQIDLNCLPDKTLVLSLTILFETMDTALLNINNSFVERNACDETEVGILADLNFLDNKLKRLRKSDQAVYQRDKNEDIMDNISLLNLSILEEPFQGGIDLACTSCRLDMLPPIFLCGNGHNVCSRCKSEPCRKCTATITICRNTDLENVSRTHRHQCRYAVDGCTEKLYYNEVRGHEAKCPFCKYRCASAECSYEGRFEHFVHHLNVHHASTRISSGVRVEFPKNTEFYIVNRAVGVFHCKSEQQGEKIRWKAMFCGPKERQFFCELTFKGSKFKEAIFMRRHGTEYEIEKSTGELKKMKTKDKYALINVTSYDN